MMARAIHDSATRAFRASAKARTTQGTISQTYGSERRIKFERGVPALISSAGLPERLTQNWKDPNVQIVRSTGAWRLRDSQQNCYGAADSRTLRQGRGAESAHGRLLRAAGKRRPDHFRGDRHQPRGPWLAQRTRTVE